MIVGFRHREIQHIRSLNIRNLLEHHNKFRKIIEFRKPCFCSVSGAFGSKLNGSNGFAIVRSPSIKVNQISFLEGVILQIFLHRIHLNHTVGDRCTCSKTSTFTTSNFIKITTLHIKVAGLHCFGLANTRYVSHFRKSSKVFIIVSFIDKQTVYAKFLKGNNIIFSALVV